MHIESPKFMKKIRILPTKSNSVEQFSWNENEKLTNHNKNNDLNRTNEIVEAPITTIEHDENSSFIQIKYEVPKDSASSLLCKEIIFQHRLFKIPLILIVISLVQVRFFFNKHKCGNLKLLNDYFL